jgi:hypothetical protein
MYNPEEDIIDPELLAQALAISSVPVIYKVYFDKDTGNILSISNEENKDYLNSIDVEFEVISDFLKNKKQITNYKIVFVDLTTPAIVSKFDTDVKLISIEQVKHVDHWDSMFTIENYPLLEQWGFQLRSDQRAVLQSHNLNSQFEIFVVDKNNSNMLLRTIKLSLKSLLESDRIYVSYQSNKESDLKNRIFVRKFFSTIGYQILYDTNS